MTALGLNYRQAYMLIPRPMIMTWYHLHLIYCSFPFQVFAKIISIQHEVYLQVWRPSEEQSGVYTLIAQTFFHPSELRFQEVRLRAGEYIHVRRGDVLGLYFPNKNPLAYSSVPCAYNQQHYNYISKPKDFHVGYTLRFNKAPPGEHACRHYSFTAMFGTYILLHVN